jgi:predicted nucleotidyltransferase
MDMSSLCKALIKETALLEEIDRLIRLKATANEGDIVQRSTILDEHIASVLQHNAERTSEATSDNRLIESADQLFRDVIS